MDRLTRSGVVCGDKYYEALGFGAIEQRPFFEIIKRLAYYEDLSEQGKLIELPCKVGDTVYVVSPLYTFPKKYIHERKICRFVTINNDWYFETEVFSHKLDEFGVNVFSTYAEAELKLKEYK